MRFLTIAKRSALVAVLLASSAHAAPTFQSSAYGLKADVRVAGNTVVATGQLAPVSGTGGADYNRTTQLASVSQSVRIIDTLTLDAFQTLGAGVVTTTAMGTGGVAPAASASAQIADLSLAFTTRLLGAVPLTGLTLGADAITSTASVGVAGGALVSAGSSSIVDFSLASSLLGILGIDGSLYAAATPNTQISLAGLSILVNEQQETRTGTSGIFRYTNALNIQLNDFLLAGRLLRGSIIVGHAEAGISGYAPPPPPPAAVPEPATWAMLILGFGMVGAATRRRPRYVLA